ncbi:MAG: helix-turn-helix transcriptional regulator [Eubacterium sp.]|nr:helix-turn-helix transcriptional regulator [Eubacterium sp.]
MLLTEKLEVLIKRNGYKKTEFADEVGITYRALANYINGSRKPRGAILEKMAEILRTTPDELSDGTDIVLSSDERLYFCGSSDKKLLEEADEALQTLDDIFASDMDDKDKTAFFNCIAEKYFASKAKK